MSGEFEARRDGLSEKIAVTLSKSPQPVADVLNQSRSINNSG